MMRSGLSDLVHKRVLVTGGNGGIGAAISKRLATAGADVAVNYFENEALAKSIVHACQDRGSTAFCVPADVADPNAVDKMFQIIEDRFGHLDVLVNNAAIDGRHDLLWKAEDEDFKRVIEVNFLGAYYCMRNALRQMVLRRTGVIINITSIHEIMPWRGYGAYSASKSALSMLTKTAALESAEFGIRVLAVAPGAIQTGINKKVWRDSRLRQRLIGRIPLKRMGHIDEVADLIVYLASDAAKYQTGSTVFIDGGMMLYP